MVGSNVVFHGSPTRGLELIEPARSTHGRPWVYACRDQVMAALFVSGTGGDLTCAVGRESTTRLPYVCERFAGALGVRYGKRSGSIYTLPGATFVSGYTGWDEEVVSRVSVRPVSETRVEDVLKYLLGLHEQGLLTTVRYPGRIGGIPEDDEDLVMRGIVWTRDRGDGVLEGFRRYHPQLVARISAGLSDGRYPEGFARPK
jgi:hypothetical protein